MILLSKVAMYPVMLSAFLMATSALFSAKALSPDSVSEYMMSSELNVST